MVGIVMITHGNLGKEFIQAGQNIYGQLKQVMAVSILPNEGVDIARNKLMEAVTSVDTGDGVLLLADGFGGSPANLCLRIMPDINCEIITGLNLNMLMEALCYQSRLSLKEFAIKVESGGNRGIVHLSEMFRNRLKSSQEGK